MDTGPKAGNEVAILDKKLDERKYLTPGEVERLLEAAKTTAHPERDRCLILLMFRHGLRVSEALQMPVWAVDIEGRVLHVARLKGGLSTSHPLRADELRALRAWLIVRLGMLRDDGDRNGRRRAARRGSVSVPETEVLFISARRRALDRRSVWVLLRALGVAAGLPVEVHPHMLRHACGYALADQGADTRLIQDYMGHRNIQHTVRYTATNPARFGTLWRSGGY